MPYRDSVPFVDTEKVELDMRVRIDKPLDKPGRRPADL
jgi:hypothetical protein